jgi:hypothetical protein
MEINHQLLEKMFSMLIEFSSFNLCQSPRSHGCNGNKDHLIAWVGKQVSMGTESNMLPGLRRIVIDLVILVLISPVAANKMRCESSS